MDDRLSRVIPTLRYRDAHAAIDWLCRVFGFERHLVVDDDKGGVAHAQLTLGGGMLMLGSAREGDVWSRHMASPSAEGIGTQSVCIVIADVDAAHARAVEAGATIIDPLSDRDYGGRGFGCVDPQGHSWWAGSYDPWVEA